MHWNQPLVSGEESTRVYHQLRAATGSPARVTLKDPETGITIARVPGLVRRVVVTGFILDLEIPMFSATAGQRAEVEVLSASALIRCTTVIQELESARVLYLEIPEGLDIVQRRRHPRIDVNLEALAQEEEAGRSVPIHIMNLSVGGVGFVSAAAHPPGTTLRLHLNIAGLNPAEIPVRVVRCELMGPEKWMVGASFQALNPAQEAKLSQYIATVLHEQ